MNDDSTNHVTAPIAASPEIPPAFSPWMRRLDPLLALEDSNPLFQAFRIHHLEHGRRQWRKFRRIDAVWGGRRSLWVIALILLAIGAFFSIGIFTCLFFPGLIVAGAFVRSRMRSRNPSSRFPRRLSEALSNDGFHEAFCNDLLLLPSNGRQIAEALYLEYRQRQLAWIQLIIPLLTIGLCLYLCIHASPRIQFTFLLVVVVLWLGWELMVAAASGIGIRRACKSAIENRFVYWNAKSMKSAYHQLIRAGTVKMIELSAILYIGAILLVVLVGLLVFAQGVLLFLIEWIDKVIDVRRLVTPHFILIVVGVVMSLPCLAIRAVQPGVRRRAVYRTLNELSRAEEARDGLRCIVMRDSA